MFNRSFGRIGERLSVFMLGFGVLVVDFAGFGLVCIGYFGVIGISRLF